MNDLVIHKKRNSLIELYRFLFAFNVIIGHGLFPIDIPYFGPDRISVEFFFILSGYLFAFSLEKYRKMPLKYAVRTMLASKIKPLLVPLIIGLVSNAILNYITGYNPLKLFRYLWYIPAMIIAFLIFIVLRFLIKSNKKFWSTVAAILVLSVLLRFSGSELLFFFDYLRSVLAISLGMLLTKIPSFSKRKWVCWVVLVLVAITIFVIVFLGLARDSKFYEALLDIVLYPILICVTFNVNCNLHIFNYLGGLSFGMYAFQCPARLLLVTVYVNPWIPFVLIFVLALIDDAAKRIIKHQKCKAIGG